MHSWPVVCIETTTETTYDDCRGIDEIGFLVANTVRSTDVEQARGMIESGLAAFHLDGEDHRIPLQPAATDGVRYLRTLDEDSPDDPLLDLGSCGDVELSSRYDL